jgi:hypothetical protein
MADEPYLSLYQDLDGDDYGVNTGTLVCSTQTGYSLLSGDCNDADARIHPATIWYLDADTDGFCPGTTVTQCATPVNYYLPDQLVNSSTSGAGLSSGLVGYWSFDWLDARDGSGKGNTGTIV